MSSQADAPQAQPLFVQYMTFKADPAWRRLPLSARNDGREALALALESPGSLVILDDGLARRYAAHLGLRLIGTLGVLIRAKRQGLIAAVAPVLDQLDRLRFRVDPATRATVLLKAADTLRREPIAVGRWSANPGRNRTRFDETRDQVSPGRDRLYSIAPSAAARDHTWRKIHTLTVGHRGLPVAVVLFSQFRTCCLLLQAARHSPRRPCATLRPWRLRAGSDQRLQR